MKRSEDGRKSRNHLTGGGYAKWPPFRAGFQVMIPNLEMTSAIENDVTERLSHVQLLQLVNFKTLYFIDKQLFCEFCKLGKNENFLSTTVTPEDIQLSVGKVTQLLNKDVKVLKKSAEVKCGHEDNRTRYARTSGMCKLR